MRLAAPVLCAASILAVACNDDISQIGDEIAKNEVTIVVDSTFTVTGQSVKNDNYDPRTTTSLIGSISVPQYGDLSCSYMSQMLAAASMNIPDSITVDRVDSVKMILRMPRNAFTGDSLAPQQLSVYQLTKPLTVKADNNYDPKDYYTASSLLGRRSYTMTALGLNDSLFKKSLAVDVPVRLNDEFGRKIFEDYRNDPAIFQWPSTFSKYFAGIYVENSFGGGCMSNVGQAMVVLYYYRLQQYRHYTDSVNYEMRVRHVKDSTVVFSTAPEVLSVNNVKLNVAPSILEKIGAGQSILLSPAGYNVRIQFPLMDILDRYDMSQNAMTVVDNLTFSVPVSLIENEYGISIPPNLLMVKTDELESFFAENKAPDSKTSFWAGYDSKIGSYTFSSMRDYIKYALEHRDEMDESYCDFTLVPVSLVQQEKYVGYNQTENVVVGCTPYVLRPSMAILHLDNAKIKFTLTRQEIY